MIYAYLFFLDVPPLPTTTLFPYTTLFRSTRTPRRRSARRARLPRSSNARRGNPLPRAGTQSERFPVARHDDRRAHARQDRKSTRLNSSHSQISYAVFCLKKKI